MVTSCSSGWVREAWWSTVPSMRSLRRLGGTGMPLVSLACGGTVPGRDARHAGGGDIRHSSGLSMHSSVIIVTRKENHMAGHTRAVPVRLTIKRHRKLEQIVRAATTPQRLVLRARIVLAAAAGAV